MEIEKIYDPKLTEEKWYSYWLKNNFFKSTPDNREPYTIVIPPPNVTGVLHMGHMLNNTIQDVLIRKARMEGKNACWVPGTDHASIATEAKVVALLKEKGITKKDLSREEFLKHAWAWKEKYGGIILKQLEKLGASCDWDRTRFTMEDSLSEAVIDVFIDLHSKGHIYRGVRMVNWDPQGLTAVSDEEVIYKEVNSKLFYVKYKLANDSSNKGQAEELDEWITIATTRPETILGDTAVCVHPNDERYKHLKGKRCIVPIVNRTVPIIFDDYITMEFGTGALKVTPAHDINDYNIGLKHNLEIIDTIAEDGKMSEDAKYFVGLDRFDARKKIASLLEELGQIVKVEDIKNKVGYSERTNAVIEPKLSMQWFLKMEELAKPALENVLNGDIKLIPEKFVNTYKHWMENVHDWCISRQLWWGQQIPAWYDDKGFFVIAKTHDEAIAKYKIEKPNSTINKLNQDEDVLDTWFSSWLWPISVFDGFKNPDGEIKYYYPTNDLVTGPDILFFWVARMIIAGYEFCGNKPFTNVYLTGIVRDKQGKKMSKQLGNSPDPIELIEKYGADGVRMGMLLCAPAGNDLLFDESYCEQGRNFSNKIWNAFRLIKGWEVDERNEQSKGNKISINWFESKLNEQLDVINDYFTKYRISEALMSTYKLVWDDFCSWYLEMIKPEFVDGKSLPIDKSTLDSTINFFEKILKILHPFMPFITEEIWHLLKVRTATECLIVASWPTTLMVDKNLLSDFSRVFEDIQSLRNLKATNKLNPKKEMEIEVTDSDAFVFLEKFNPIYRSLSGNVFIKTNLPKNKFEYFSGSTSTNYFLPIEKNIEDEKARLLASLEYSKGFLKSVISKLSNDKFVSNAKPELLAIEIKKRADTEVKIKTLEDLLASLS